MRILIAARLSAGKKGGQQGGGIETQDERVREWCDREDHTVVDVIKDTKSGTVAPWKRKNLRPWFTDPELLARFDAIAVYKMDRLSRADWSDEVQIRQWAEANGKKLIIVDCCQWPPRPNSADRITWEILSDLARKEWEAIKERTGRARVRRDEKDSFSGKKPWGYDIVPRHPGQTGYEDKIIVPNALGRKWIPLMFQRCRDGWGFRKICNWLTAEGVPHEGDNAWGYNTVRKMMQNTIYIGEHRHTTGPKKGGLIRNYEPIVSEDLFYTVQAVIKNRRNAPRGPVNAETRALLGDVLFCMFCGSHMYRIGSSKPVGAAGAIKRRYRCASALGWKTGQKTNCPNSISEEGLNRVIDELMKRKTGNIFRKVAISNDRAARLEKVLADLDHLPLLGLEDEDYDIELKRLRRKRDELKSPPSEEDDEPEDEDTGIRYCDQWAELGDNDKARGDWLRKTDTKIYACPGYTDDDDIRLFAAIGRPRCPIKDGQQLPDKIFGVYIKTDLMPKMLEVAADESHPWELGTLLSDDTPEEVVSIEELDRLAAYGRSTWNVNDAALVAA